MQITDVLTSPWAIVPEKLLEIHAIYDARVKGERIDLAAVEARIGKPLANENQGYQINNGVAVIPIHGVIAKKMNMFDAISGGVSTQLVARDIRAAVDDPAVKSILLHIDSPGGTVDGTQTLANLVKEASAIKPVMTFADGVMASAAYWIGSAASEIVSSGDTTQIGSIGVVTTHKDISKAEEKSGVKTTEISAGKYKRIASQFSPLSEEAQAHLQDQVDQLYTIFVDSVAENRDVSSDVVLEQMADGRVFLSKEALKRGMIDHIATFEQTITNMQNGVWPMNQEVTNQPAAASADNAPVANKPVSIDEIKAAYPEISQALINEGAEKERARIKSCEEASMRGYENLVASMKFDGKSTGETIALAIVREEQKIRNDKNAAFVSNAPQPVKSDPVNALEKPKDEAKDKVNDQSLPLEERAKAAWDSDAGLRAEFSSFGSYFSFVEANGGKL
ncbi:signal peptide peptidase SppA [Nitrosomonas communis]